MGSGLDRRSPQCGQAAVLIALSLFSMVVFLAMATNFGILVNDRIRMQNAADLSAYAGAFEQARVMNRMTELNARIHHVAAMTRKQLTCQDMPNLNEAIQVGEDLDNDGDWEDYSGYDCGGGIRTLIALGCDLPPRAPEAYIKLQAARMDIDAVAFMALNYRGKGSPDRAGRFTALRNISGLGRPRHHTFYEWNPESPTSKMPPRPLVSVRRVTTTFNYAQWYRRGQCSFCPKWKKIAPFIWVPVNIGGCIRIFTSGPYESWFVKDPPGPSVYFPVRVNGVPLKQFLDIDTARGGYFGGDAQRGAIRGTDELWAFAVAKPFGGSLGSRDGEGVRHGVTFSFWTKSKSGNVYDYSSFGRPNPSVGAAFVPLYRARMAGVQEPMMTASGTEMHPVELMLQDLFMATHVGPSKAKELTLH